MEKIEYIEYDRLKLESNDIKNGYEKEYKNGKLIFEGNNRMV